MSITTIRQSLHEALLLASEAVKKDFQQALANGVSVEVNEKISKTGLPDFVTKTDKRSEGVIQKSLYNSHPSITFVGEESGGRPQDSGYFLVDPLDGTSNFMSLRGYFSICAAYIEDGEVLAAAVAAPISGQIFSAEKGKGVYLDNVPLSLQSKTLAPLKKVQLECELALDCKSDFDLLQKVLPHTSGLRKSGSTALDLMHLAQGQQMICIANHLEPYDIAAPLLIAREAGCIVSDFQGNTATINSSEILAAKPEHHKNALNFILGK